MSRRLLSLAVVLASVVGMLAADLAGAASSARTLADPDVRARVEQHVGVLDAECPPRVGVDHDGHRTSLTEDDVAMSIQCALSLSRRGLTFWTYWEMSGIDTTSYQGLAGRPPDWPERRLRCQNEPRALTDGELSEALARLSVDVVSTLGPAHSGLVARVTDELAHSADRTDQYFLPQVGDAVQRYVRDTLGRDPWPACPRHPAHALVLRDLRWYCEQDLTFLGELGTVARVLHSPAVP